jgi:hypothetical protein
LNKIIPGIIVVSALVVLIASMIDTPVESTFISVPPSLMFPLGEVSYFDTTGTTVNIITQSNGYTNFVKIEPTTIFINNADFTNGGVNDGTLEYTGFIGKYFHIAASITTSATNNNDILVYTVAKNGVPMDSSKIMMKLGQTTDVTSSAMHVVVFLEDGDQVEVQAANFSGNADIIVKSLNFVAVSMK